MTKWTLSEDAVEVAKGADFYTAGIDFYIDPESSDSHWHKVEIHDVNADTALRLANIITAALNEREAITDG